MIKYYRWILENVKDDSYGQCHEVARKMAREFPELTYVRGWYHCPVWGKRMHAWCLTSDDKIIDPAVQQFPSKGTGRYEQISDSDLPTGKCVNCGELLFTDGTYFCSKVCAEECAKNL